jgi:hypothetical protein
MEINETIEKWYLELAAQEYDGQRYTLANLMIESGLV